MDIHVELAEAGSVDLDEICQMYDAVWPGRESATRTMTSWAFGGGNPMGSPPLLLARTRRDGRLVGVRGGIVWPMTLGKKSPRAIQLHGTAIHPVVQRQGLFTSLTKEFVAEVTSRGFELLFNVSVAGSRAGYEKLGWQYGSTFRNRIALRRPHRLLVPSSRSGVEPPAPQALHAAPPFEEIEPLLEKRHAVVPESHGTPALPRPFFEWRFIDSVHQWAGDRVRGFVVYRRTEKMGLSTIVIGNVWEGSWSVRRLLHLAIAAERPELLVAWVSDQHAIHRPLRRAGFWTYGRAPLHLGTKSLAESSAPTICLTSADVDTF